MTTPIENTWPLRTTLLLFLTLCCYTSALSQSKSLALGGGIAPVHWAAQSDFNAFAMPYDVFVMYKQNHIGIRLDYNWNGAYKKDRFSYNNTTIELSLIYDYGQLLGLKALNPYLRLGATNWRTDFTTEGYPGIEDYKLKIEKDNGYGAILATGINYPYRAYSFGIEFQYAKNGNSQFIAGGFEPQDLLSDNLRIMVTAQYDLVLNKNSSYGQIVACPKF